MKPQVRTEKYVRTEMTRQAETIQPDEVVVIHGLLTPVSRNQCNIVVVRHSNVTEEKYEE